MKGAGVNGLIIEVPDTEGGEQIPPKVVTLRLKFDKSYMKEIGRRSRILDNSTQMTSPMKKNESNDITHWGDNIILSKEIGEESRDKHTRTFLKRLKYVPRYLPNNPPPSV